MLELLTKLLFLYLPFQIALNPAEGFDLASARIIIPILFLTWLANSLKNKKIIIPNNLNFFLLMSFLFLALFSLFFATNPAWGIRKILFIFSIIPIFFVVYDKFSSNKRKTISLLKFTVWGAVGISLVALIQFNLQFVFSLEKIYSIWANLIVPFLGDSFSKAVLTNPSWLVNIGGHTLLRATAFFPDPHMLAFYLNITGLISLGIYFQQNKKIYLLFSIIPLTVSLLTFSRGGYLGLIAGLLFFSSSILRLKLKYIFKSPRKILIISALLILIISFFIPNPVSNRLFSSFSLSEGSNIGRIQTWKQSLEIIYSHPAIGVGLGNYAINIKPSADYREPIYSHNTYFDIAAETGILNAFIWLLLLIFAIINFNQDFIKNNNFIKLSLASALISFSIHSLFETAIFSVHVLPLIILILGLASKINSQDTHK